MNVSRDELWKSFEECLAAYLGLHFPAHRRPDLERGLRAAARELGFDDLEAFGAWFRTCGRDRHALEAVAAHLTVGETYFFREPRCFRALESTVFPEVIAQRSATGRRIRAWSAGCCTGEEPYSLAISLSHVLPKDWNATILATDVNPSFLKRASEGVFGEWSFRDVPASLKSQYFTRVVAGQYQIAARQRRMVAFSYLNLAEDSFPSPVTDTQSMDLILCRNVLIYMDPDMAVNIIRRLERCLAEDGWLFVGAAEASLASSAGLTPCSLNGLIAFRRALPPQRAARASTVARLDSSCATSAGAPESPISRSGFFRPSRPLAVSAKPQPPARRPPPADGTQFAREAESPVAPIDAHSVADVARTYADRGDFSIAMSRCNEAMRAEKLNPGLHFLNGVILQELGRPQEAASAFKKAIFLAPDFVMAHFALAYLADRLGRRAIAPRHLRRAAQLLQRYGDDDIVPEAGGLTARRLAEIISAMLQAEPVQ